MAPFSIHNSGASIKPRALHSDFLDAVYGAALELQGNLQIGTPTYYVSPTDEEIKNEKQKSVDNLPYFLLRKVDRLGRTLQFQVEIGRESDHDALRSRDGSNAPMRGKAAVRYFGICMFFPRQGEYAVMLSEVRGRSYGGELLVQWLTRTAQRANASIDAKGNRIEDPWLGIKYEPRIDGHRLDGILEESANHVLRLRRNAVSPTGERQSYDLELVQYGLKKTSPQQIAGMIKGMWDRRGKGTRTSRSTSAAKDMLSIVEPDDAPIVVNFLER